jgi:hypothetical protein
MLRAGVQLHGEVMEAKGGGNEIQGAWTAPLGHEDVGS